MDSLPTARPTCQLHLRALKNLYFGAMKSSLMRIQYLALLYLGCSIVACSPEGAHAEFPVRVMQKAGDNSSWSSPTFDDRQWRSDATGSRDSIFWLRVHFDLTQSLKPTRNRGILIFGLGAQELYWDGVWVGKNGSPGSTAEEERPGQLSNYFMIPDSLGQVGRHVLAMRCSQQHEESSERFLQIVVSDYFEMLRYPLIVTSFMHILAGAYLLAGIYFLFLFFTYRKEATVFIFGIICLIFFSLILLEYLKFYVLYPYTWHYPRLKLIGWLTMAAAFLVPSYFGLQFRFPKLKWVLGGYLCLLIAFYYVMLGQHDNTARMMGRCMWMFSLTIVAYGAFRSVKGAPLVLIGLLCSAVIDRFFIYDISLYSSFTIIVFSMFYLLTLRGKAQQEAYTDSLLLSARLKNELLKKHIQPHFLMNTLTSLIDWVEESPQEGVKFMEALADEFDILSQVADHRLIPIGQEIQLCKSHLVVMGYRKEIDYQWEEEGIDYAETIPPALIHTVLENGITHSLPRIDGTVGFKLQFKRTDHERCYTLSTYGQNRRSRGAIKKGTGFRYIESRLRESYGDKWKLSAEAIPEGWMTQIKIYAP